MGFDEDEETSVSDATVRPDDVSVIAMSKIQERRETLLFLSYRKRGAEAMRCDT